MGKEHQMMKTNEMKKMEQFKKADRCINCG
jgi:hypothetical protein